jgi:putative endonuclease
LKTKDAWYVYVAECSDGSLYTGIAKDVEARIALHNEGKGAKYTRGRGPLVVRGRSRALARGKALRLEIAIKRVKGVAKLKMLKSRRRAK